MKTQSNNKLVFFGTPEFGIPYLNVLVADGFDVVGVVTQPDKPKGRGQILSPSPIKQAAEGLGLKVFTPDKITNEFIADLKKLDPAVLFVVAYGKILPDELLNLAPFGCLNIHPSLLSKYRGPSPIESSILNGDDYTGVTLMKLDKEMDHGPILSQSRVNIVENETALELGIKLNKQGVILMRNVLPKYLNSEIKPITQDHTRATYTKKIEKSDAEIDWHEDADKILNQIRAYNPRPIAFTIYNGSPLRIYQAVKSNSFNLEPGFFKVDKINNKFLIGTKTDPLEILVLQLAGKKQMTVQEYLNGLKK